jgi:hypothetical protein
VTPVSAPWRAAGPGAAAGKGRPEAGFYVQRLRIDDPQAPKAMKLEILDLNGRTAGHAENVEVTLKILDGGPGPTRAEECTESWGRCSADILVARVGSRVDRRHRF